MLRPRKHLQILIELHSSTLRKEFANKNLFEEKLLKMHIYKYTYDIAFKKLSGALNVGQKTI